MKIIHPIKILNLLIKFLGGGNQTKYKPGKFILCELLKFKEVVPHKNSFKKVDYREYHTNGLRIIIRPYITSIEEANSALASGAGMALDSLCVFSGCILITVLPFLLIQTKMDTAIKCTEKI